MKTKSGLFTLNIRDGYRGLLMLVGTLVLTYLQTEIPNWDIDIKLQAALSAFINYLLMNFFTKGRPKTIPLTGETYTLWYTPNNRQALEALCPFLNFPGEQYQQWFIIIQDFSPEEISAVEGAISAGKVAGWKPGSHPSQPPA